MSMKYIRDYYGVPAKRGMRIFYDYPKNRGQYGTITGSQGASLRVRLDDRTRPCLFHPTWKIYYPCEFCNGTGRNLEVLVPTPCFECGSTGYLPAEKQQS